MVCKFVVFFLPSRKKVGHKEIERKLGLRLMIDDNKRV